MKYEHIHEGTFLERPNRFIAYAMLDGHRERVHVKNTGRCRELLTEGATVYLNRSDKPERSTAYDLVAVQKGEKLINMDSQAPNKAVEEWLRSGGLFRDTVLVKPETVYDNSRFDFYVETGSKKVFIEVKGVTLEQDGAVRFPDAPSERALKHVQELIKARREGYRAILLFVVQMEGVCYFEPNHEMQPEFGKALIAARREGVEVLAYDCIVTPQQMRVNRPVKVRLSVLDEIAAPLLAWYDRGRRVLPWREEPTPYHVWVSEIMLQQTRVEAVKPYYDRFMKALPDVQSLAQAKEEELLKLWEGLGYYNRVRNLGKAARMVMEEYGGRMPEDYEALLKLPGIGSYTAGAISSIAYGRAVPAVDGNVLRVLSRLRKDERDIAAAQVRKEIETELREVMPQRPGDFNQALMELGAMVCVPNGVPHCEECPWEKLCSAHLEGCELSYPNKSAKKERVIEEKTVLILRDKELAALRKRPAKGLLAGMYEFPCLPGRLSREQVIDYLKKQGLSILRIESLPDSRHIFTHREWHMTGYAVRVDELAERKGDDGLIFVDQRAAKETYPIPSAYNAYKKFFLST